MINIDNISDDAIAHLSQLLLDASEERELIEEAVRWATKQDWLFRRAYWAAAVSSVGERIQRDGQQRFMADHSRAWAEYFLAAARAMNLTPGISCDVRDRLPPRSLLVVWHFPEFPKICGTLVESGASVLVARTAPWMCSALGLERLIKFRESVATKIVKDFQEGVPVVAMMDFCYPETSAHFGEFLGYRARTPSGIVRLAQRYGYTVFVVIPRESGVVRFEQLVGPRDVDSCITVINSMISNEIARFPARWLFWAWLPDRWENPPYERSLATE